MRRRRRRNGITFSLDRKEFDSRKVIKELLNWLLVVFIAIVCGYFIVTFCFQSIYVVGPSMNNTLEDEDRVIINKLAYVFSDIERYDIVAFKKFNDDSYYDIKRVIGLPDETIQIKDGRIFVNGNQLLDMPYEDIILTYGIANEEITLGKEEYFVLGDNVNNSEDSRFITIGNVSEGEIKGKVIYILSPKDKRGKVSK